MAAAGDPHPAITGEPVRNERGYVLCPICGKFMSNWTSHIKTQGHGFVLERKDQYDPFCREWKELLDLVEPHVELDRLELSRKLPLALQLEFTHMSMETFSVIDDQVIEKLADRINNEKLKVQKRKQYLNFISIAKKIRDQDAMWKTIFEFYKSQRDDIQPHEILLALCVNPHRQLIEMLSEMMDEDFEQDEIIFPVSYKNDYILGDWITENDKIRRTTSFDEANFFHGFYVSSAVIIITSDTDYLVKIRNFKGNIRWKNVTQDELKKQLNRCHAKIQKRKEASAVNLSYFLTIPEITRNISKFPMSVFYDPDPFSRFFSVWREHAHPILSKEGLSENLHIIQPWLNFLKNDICKGNDEHFKAITQQLGMMYQKPEKHGRWAIVLLSGIIWSRNREELLHGCSLRSLG
jgi:hypothetical protein